MRESLHVYEQSVFVKYLYLPLNFFVDLKLL